MEILNEKKLYRFGCQSLLPHRWTNVSCDGKKKNNIEGIMRMGEIPQKFTVKHRSHLFESQILSSSLLALLGKRIRYDSWGHRRQPTESSLCTEIEFRNTHANVLGLA